MEKIIDIQGMHCKSCAEKIEAKLSNIEGVEKVRVSLVEEKAFVKFDPTKVDVDTIKREIQSIGYETDISSDNSTELPATNVKLGKSSIKQGIVYGLIPHTGCIAFIIASILGVTAATEFFKPLLLNPYFFYILIGLSFTFATISSAFYLRKNGLLSSLGIIRKWKYLSTMYGSTIGINLLLFLVIFPLLANVSFAQSTTGNFIGAVDNGGINTLSSLKLQVDIPCSGHAPLISDELKTISGVVGIQFSLPNIFDVKYDSTKTSKQQILSLDVFKTYKATVLGEESNQSTEKSSVNLAAATNDVQTVKLSVQGSNYYPNPIRVKKGIPVQLVADINNMSGCSRNIVIPEFGVRKVVSTTDNVIEFTPDKSGTFNFSCSMGMYLGQIVVEEYDGSVSAFTGSAPVTSSSSCGSGSCGCGCGSR
jgi:copper chaperone CopZ/plastocyanin